jgi:hypothetical protein
VRSRMTKEEYSQLGLKDGQEVSVRIRSFRILAAENAPLAPELSPPQPTEPLLGEGI